MRTRKNVKIGTNLTVENALQRGYQYNADYEYNPDLEPSLEQGYILGNPALKDGIKQGVFGLYEPHEEIDMNNRPKLDKTLTPENAKERGYIWLVDSIYDPKEQPEEAIKDIREAVKKGWLNGQSASYTLPDGVGLYKPLL